MYIELTLFIQAVSVSVSVSVSVYKIEMFYSSIYIL